MAECIRRTRRILVVVVAHEGTTTADGTATALLLSTAFAVPTAVSPDISHSICYTRTATATAEPTVREPVVGSVGTTDGQ